MRKARGSEGGEGNGEEGCGEKRERGGVGNLVKRGRERKKRVRRELIADGNIRLLVKGKGKREKERKLVSDRRERKEEGENGGKFREG